MTLLALPPVIHEDKASVVPATEILPLHPESEDDDWVIAGEQAWIERSSHSVNDYQSPGCTQPTEHLVDEVSSTSSHSTGLPSSMGRKRISFTRIDNIPQVRIDVKHLSYSVKNPKIGASATPLCPSPLCLLRSRWQGLRARRTSSMLLQEMTKSTAHSSSSNTSRNNTKRPTDHLRDVPLSLQAVKPPPPGDSEPPLTPILHNISLSFTPGTLTALMGPSASGKTSLLQVLHGAAKHTRGGQLQGSVLINGTPCHNIHHAFRQLCSLVPQEDVLLPELTVHETLRFAAELRLPQSDTREEKEETVGRVLAELGLLECKDVRIGGVERVGISGGQRRRVSIGLELLTDPSVLLLDEATSGLDSKSAEDICYLLQSLAGPDRCAVCSIHQPSYQIFMTCFDRVVFLVAGQVAYEGTPNRLAGFFYSLGFEAPSYGNPADFYLKVLQESPDLVLDAWRHISVKREQEDIETAMAATPGLTLLQPPTLPSSSSAARSPRSRRHKRIRNAFRRWGLGKSPSTASILPLRGENSTSVGALLGPGAHGVASCDSLVVPGGDVLVIDRHASWLDKETSEVLAQTSLPYQFSVLFRRMLTHTCKDRAKVLMGLGMEVFTGLVVGTVWFQQNVHAQGSIFPVLGVLCMLTTIAVFDSFLNLILTFPMTRAVHFREYHNGYYHLLPYFLASMASACLQSAIYLIVNALLVFFMVGLPFSVARLGVYLGVCALGGCIGASLGFLVGCLTSDIQRMQQIMVPMLLPLLIFSGYMIPLDRIPAFLRWIYHVSFYQYMYSSLVISHFSGLEFHDCHASTSGVSAGSLYACKERGEEVLSSMALSPDQLVRNVGVLLGMLALLLCLGYTALRYKSR